MITKEELCDNARDQFGITVIEVYHRKINLPFKAKIRLHFLYSSYELFIFIVYYETN